MSLTPEILFEDTHLVVLSKPAGLLSQGDISGELSLVDWLRNYFGRHYVGLIHRLDRNTSGVMVVAKRTKAATRLSAALQEGDLIRTYWAWLTGTLCDQTVWRHWLLKDEAKNQVEVVSPGTTGAKEAELKVTPLEHRRVSGNDLTLAEFILKTGRSHQIRVQAEASGHSILGDPKYGDTPAMLKKLFSRPALHSRRIEFTHPMSQERLSFMAPLPQDFEALMPKKAER